MNNRKIAFLTDYDARNINRWSGTAYFMSTTLEKSGFDVEYIGPLKENFQCYIKLLDFYYRNFSNKKYLALTEPLRLKSFAKQAQRKLKKINPDIILSPNLWSIAYLKSEKPVVLWADCTFAAMVDFYPYYTNLCRKSLNDGNRAETLNLNNCRLAIFASDWAARSAIEKYGANPEKVKVVPYGANIICNRTRDDILKLIEGRPKRPCKLLFIGKIWSRKGGDIAVDTAIKLNQLGLETELTLVGSLPGDVKNLPDFVKPIGFIDKSKPEGKQLIERLFAEAHFLILPSRAEAYGIVFCEANSFAVPCISTNVGGIPTVIKDGVNGKTFPLNASADDYANYLLTIMNNYDNYKPLALSSFNEYKTRLNWDSAVAKVKSLIESI
ncbi:MAG TPA: glycosyltransferase family 4 protein [Verrucomicrobiota bacterium]|nr:glycosyltransferase family 4 protein [Verrucomicrobiota bacterium]